MLTLMGLLRKGVSFARQQLEKLLQEKPEVGEKLLEKQVGLHR